MKLTCAMSENCNNPVTHIGSRGFVYCSACAKDRQYWERCRRMRQWEIRRLEAGECISYEPKSQVSLLLMLHAREAEAAATR